MFRTMIPLCILLPLVTILAGCGAASQPAQIGGATAQALPTTVITAPAATSAARNDLIAAIAPGTAAGLTLDACLNHTHAEAECKDCCDSLGGSGSIATDGAARKTCRDGCPGHDFSQNGEFITVAVSSALGPGGDYSLCTAAGKEQACKVCCDGSTDLQAGDRRFCRDACSARFGSGQAGSSSRPGGAQPAGGPPPAAKAGAQEPPANAPGSGIQDRPQSQPGRTAMNIEQAISDEAQRNTIAFDGLAFLTGSLGADSFFPPGKVADFWGFQFLRDNDPTEMGHNTDFLTRAALNMLSILTPFQRTELVALAKAQVDAIDDYGYRRFVLMDAFRRLLEGDLPAGSTGLDEKAVQAYSAELYRLDGDISYERAEVMGGLLSALDDTQRAALDAMVGKGMLNWPEVPEPADLAELDRDTKVAVMTYAGDMFSWYAGSTEADVYFCPERQGTYFGSFYLKDGKAMGNRDYTISSTLTGDMGQALLQALTADQAQLITGLVDAQKPALQEIVDRRKDIATLLRQFMSGSAPDKAAVLTLMKRYGELDGEIVYRYATAFAQVNASLTAEQRAQLMALRAAILGEDLLYPIGAYLYSQPIAMPDVPNTDWLFE